MHDLESEPRPAANRTPAREGVTANDPETMRGTPGGPDAAALIGLQRSAGNAAVVQLLADEGEERSPVHDVVGRGGGAALDEATRATMESRMGADFSDVRVHTDTQASQSADSVGANAYTVGSDIVFRSGKFDTSSATGQRTLAHELTHVVQQRNGPVEGSDAPGGIKVSDPSDKFEQAAEQAASDVTSTSAPSGATTAQGSVQLELDEDRGEVQRLVQRMAPEDDEEDLEA
jgi:hypothetical protein